MIFLQFATKRTGILVALLITLSGCLSNPERPDASVYGDLPHSYEQPAKDAVSALPYFDNDPDTSHFVSIGPRTEPIRMACPCLATNSYALVTSSRSSSASKTTLDIRTKMLFTSSSMGTSFMA